MLAEFQLKPYPHISDLAKLGSAAVLENFGYRQLHNFWRVWGWWQYLTSQRVWGEMPRVGFAGNGPAAAGPENAPASPAAEPSASPS
ncbi:MAG TPA: hypothetical protein VN231_02855 [Allosphingosinicella sp.]|nr:hypothetical protein [Allosphingosinicella sp.]